MAAARTLWTILIVIATGLFLGGQVAASDQQAAREVYDEGLRHIKLGDRGKAVQLFKDAALLDPTFTAPIKFLAEHYHQRFEHEVHGYSSATYYYKHLENIISGRGQGKEDPSIYDVYFKMGLLYLKGGDYGRALEKLQMVTDANARFVELDKALNAMGVAAYNLKQFGFAAESFRKALVENPAYDLARYNLWSVTSRLFLFNYLANALKEEIGHPENFEKVHLLRRLAPNHNGAKVIEARFHAATGQTNHALQLYEEVLLDQGGAPESYDLRTDMAETYLKAGRQARAAELLFENLKLFPYADPLKRLRLTEVMTALKEPATVATLETELTLGKISMDGGGVDLAGAHGGQPCEGCHQQLPSVLPIAGCEQCHRDYSNIHPLGVVPSMSIPPHFMLDPEGKIACYTCHVVHQEESGDHSLAYAGEGPPSERSDFCSQCHVMSTDRQNPHVTHSEKRKCGYCHAEEEGGEWSAANASRMCNFCHGAREKDHPRSLYFFAGVARKDLPWGPDESGCATCHEPHGTTFTNNKLKNGVAALIERKRLEDPHVPLGFSCRYCHVKGEEAAIAADPAKALRHNGDVGMLCVSCHITDQGHHPMGIKVPLSTASQGETERFQLTTESGLINCYTCHGDCCTREGVPRMIRLPEGGVLSELCWQCHNQQRFARRAPHVEDKRFCIYCHENPPAEENSWDSRSDVPENVCIHCHEVVPHPIGTHLGKSLNSNASCDDFPLDAQGRILCHTCHRPHATDEKVSFRLRLSGKDLCRCCHTEL